MDELVIKTISACATSRYVCEELCAREDEGGLPGQYGNGIPPWRNGYKAKNGGNIPKPESTGPHTRGEQEEEQVMEEREEMWVGSQQLQ